MPEANIVIVGCGHVGKAVADLAHWLGYGVTALDDRSELATPEQIPTADEVLAGPARRAASLRQRSPVRPTSCSSPAIWRSTSR